VRKTPQFGGDSKDKETRGKKGVKENGKQE
jgi:hypothetical protein